MSLPMLSAVFAFTFIAAYSDFLLAAVVLTDERLYTLALGLRTFLEGRFFDELVRLFGSRPHSAPSR